MIYNGEGLEDLNETVNRVAGALKPYLDRFDFIIAVGMSGVIVAAPVAVALRVPLVILRKPDDKSNHSFCQWIGAPAGRALWIDDFISSGKTYRYVRQSLIEYAIATSTIIRYAGCYLYSRSWEDNALRWYGNGTNYIDRDFDDDHPLTGNWDLRTGCDCVACMDGTIRRIKSKVDNFISLSDEETEIWSRHFKMSPAGTWIQKDSFRGWTGDFSG